MSKNKIKKSEMMERVNLDYKLSPVKIPSLIAQENITIISKNGNILAGELIDFTANIEMVKQNIYEFEAIVKSLKIFEKQYINKWYQYNIRPMGKRKLNKNNFAYFVRQQRE